MSHFIPGLQLNEYFYHEIIQPMVSLKYPGLSYAAARLDYGSDVIGFDTPQSMDHGWGPKLSLFISETDYDQYQSVLDEYFSYHLPFECHGYPTHFGEPLSDGGVMTKIDSYPIQHGITITTVERFFLDYLGVNINHPLTPRVWLTIPQQRLRTLRAGRIFYDGLNTLSSLRQRFDWYPHDLWLYLMANQWQRINQEEPFIGRTGSVDDPLGTRLIAARLIHNLMSLSMLLEKQYVPYIKWFGSAFQQLTIAPKVTPVLIDILNSTDWQTIEAHLTTAYLRLIKAHNSLELTPYIEPQVKPFYNRPYLVPHSARVVAALLDQVRDPVVRALPPHLGAIDQVVDNTDLLEDMQLCQSLRFLYQAPANQK